MFIGLEEIAGYYINLTKGLQANGLDVTLFCINEHPFQYESETGWWLLRLTKFAYKKRGFISRHHLLSKIWWVLAAESLRLMVFLWALIHHDVFIFSFGTSFIRGGYDLWLINKFGKRIISNIGHGSDARPPYIDGSCQSKNGQIPPLSVIVNRTNFLKNRCQRIERYSNIVICHFYSCHFLENKFVNFTNLGIPWRFGSHAIPRIRNTSDRVRVLHAPSHPAAKGTVLIRSTIDRLREKGHKIDFIEITERLHKTVLEELLQCDFVIDQIYSDTPLAGFATEAAWFGKPAVVGGYGLIEYNNFYLEESYPVSQICHPDQLESAIERLIVDPDYRQELGEAAQSFVSVNYNSEKVAKKYLSLISGEIPAHWFIKPNDILYLHGCGFSEAQIKELVRSMIDKSGLAALQLTHRPDLERAFLRLIQET